MREAATICRPPALPSLMLGVMLALLAASSANATESRCFGTPANGRLESGVALDYEGVNFSPYSAIGVGLGRTYVHSRVARTVAAAYAALAVELPRAVFVYGESGWEDGGRIKPHRTHQNGLSVDFMVPVRNADGASVPLPTGVTNKFGYAIEFDAQASDGRLSIDFEAMAAHLHALHVAARAEGIDIGRVIFERQWLPRLHATRYGAYLRKHVEFMRTDAWVRHDEHYHVDFRVRCAK